MLCGSVPGALVSSLGPKGKVILCIPSLFFFLSLSVFLFSGFKYLKLYFNKGSASQICEVCASSSLLGLSTASNGLCSMTVCFTGAKVKFHEGNLNQNTCKHYHHALLHHCQQNKQISIHQFIINNYFTKAWLYKYSKLSNPIEWQVIQTLHYTHQKNCN